MAYLLGGYIGGIFIVGLIASGIAATALKERPPFRRAFESCFFAWIICAFLAGFGMARNGVFSTTAGLLYILPAITVCLLLWLGFRRTAKADDAADDLQDTFN